MSKTKQILNRLRAVFFPTMVDPPRKKERKNYNLDDVNESMLDVVLNVAKDNYNGQFDRLKIVENKTIQVLTSMSIYGSIFIGFIGLSKISNDIGSVQNPLLLIYLIIFVFYLGRSGYCFLCVYKRDSYNVVTPDDMLRQDDNNKDESPKKKLIELYREAYKNNYKIVNGKYNYFILMLANVIRLVSLPPLFIISFFIPYIRSNWFVSICVSLLLISIVFWAIEHWVDDWI